MRLRGDLVTVAAACVLIASCGQGSSARPTEGDQVGALVVAPPSVLGILHQACPGIRKYAADLSYRGDRLLGDGSHSLTFEIGQAGKSIPKDFKAAGLACSYTVGGAVSGRVTAYGRACSEVCLAERWNGSAIAEFDTR